MKRSNIYKFFQSIRQKNILLTISAFLVGLFLQLTESTVILLVISVAVVSTWWQWRPYPINAETKLILDTLKKYPAVLIKNHSHIIAFNSKPPCLAAAYQSPVPRVLLKRALPKGQDSIEAMELSISQVGIHIFLLLKMPLNSYSHPKKILQNFQAVIEHLELLLQVKFKPAERYQTVRLFGLENYLHKPESLVKSAQVKAKTAEQPQLSPITSLTSEKALSLSSNRPINLTSSSSTVDSRNQELRWVISVVEKKEDDIQAAFAKEFSAKACRDLSVQIKDHLRSFQPRRGSRFQEPIRLSQGFPYYLVVFSQFNIPIKRLICLCVHEKAIPSLIQEYERLYDLITAYLKETDTLNYEDLQSLLNLSEQFLKKPVALEPQSKVQETTSITPKKVKRSPLIL
ncbi:MAG: hypothetical protein ACFFC7_22240 [Candidatus Hermodarchaeota archaeon]